MWNKWQRYTGNKKISLCGYLSGGGYHFTSDREAEPIALQFFTEDYRVFVIRYSVKPYCFPQQLREVARAHKWIDDVKS